MDEQPGFVVEGARVALGPLRMDLVPTYQRSFDHGSWLLIHVDTSCCGAALGLPVTS